MGHRLKRVRTKLLLAAVASAVSVGAVTAQRGQPTPPPTGTGLIAGQVVDADNGQPVGGATVTIIASVLASSGAAVRISPVVSDSQGRFYFAALPAGAYVTLPDRVGFISLPGARTVQLTDGGRVTNVKVRLRRLGTISGTVRDDGGDPVVGAEVMAFRRSLALGQPPTLTMAARDRTDDRGTYRLANMPIGEYFICACTRDPIPFDGQLLTTLAARPLDLLGVARRAATVGADAASLDNTLRTFPPTFHPNTPLASRATRVALAAGETKETIDIDLTAVKAARVTGMIIGATGPSVAASSVSLIPANDLPEAEAISAHKPMLLQPDGRFDFAGVPPGQYSLEVIYNEGQRIGGPSGAALAFLGARGSALSAPQPPVRLDSTSPPPERLWARQTISVGESDVSGLVIGLQRGATISGRVEFAGTAAPPVGQALARIGATLLPNQRFSSSPRANLQPDGTFTLTGVIPGRYVLIPSVSAPPWTDLKSITADGVDVTDRLLTIEGDLTNVVITLTDAVTATIQGTVVPPPGDSVEEIFVRMFPADRRFWQEPFGAFRRFPSARVGEDGTYNIVRVPAGEYFIVAAPGSLNHWAEAPQLEVLARTAARVTIANGEKRTIEVKR